MAFCSLVYKVLGTCCVLKKIESNVFCVKRLNRTFKFISRHRLDDNLSDGSAFFPTLSISVNGHKVTRRCWDDGGRKVRDLHKFVCFKARKLGKEHLVGAASVVCATF